MKGRVVVQVVYTEFPEELKGTRFIWIEKTMFINSSYAYAFSELQYSLLKHPPER
jgi:hypothetical protein